MNISGETTKRNQTIHWNADLVATGYTLNAEDVLSGAEVATADNEEAEITFVSDNTEVIAVSEDGKTLYAIDNGTATITVTATGNGAYYEGTDSHLFTVTADKKQTIEWDQNFMSLKTNANPKTIALTATATSGGTVTYALEAGSDNCVTLSGENNSVMTITGTPGVAYIIATQAGGEINGEVWIEASARKQIKVRDPNSACDEYALADQSFTFSKGDKDEIAKQEYALVGKPTSLTFTAKRGNLKYTWSEQQDMIVDQYANFGSGLEWRQLTTLKPGTSNANYGPYALEETATKIRFRSGEHAEQNVSNISVPRKKELIVSETAINETAERNVKWSKTISVSRSNIDVVDVSVVSNDPNCAFAVSKNSIGTDCADRSTETFEVSITPREKDSVYTGTITITDGKAIPTTRTVSLQIKTVGFKQSINDFELPSTALTTDTITFHATATSELEVSYISSDSTIAYVEDTVLVILSSGNVAITAYQAGDDRYNEASITKSIELTKTPTEIFEAPTASEMAQGDSLGIAILSGGEASVAGRFVWENEAEVMDEMGSFDRTVVFIPDNEAIYARCTTTTTVEVVGEAEPVILVMPTASELTYGEGLSQSELTGGVANVAGVFTWFDPDLTLTVGSNSVDA